MIKTMLSALTVALSLGAAHAQSVETNPQRTQVDFRDAHYTVGSPGTVGAMNAYVNDLVTSPQDVVLQQQGRNTTVRGAQPVSAPVEVTGYSAGTVGAAPGQ